MSSPNDSGPSLLPGPSLGRAESADSTVPAFDVLRAVLSVGICAYHLGWLPIGFGQAIMEAFFALSGFLVTKSLYCSTPTGELQLRRSDIARFWLRRFWRLAPALFVFVSISIFLSRVLSHRAMSHAAMQVGLGGLIWISNFLTIGLGLAGKSPGPFGAIWSLAVEEQFYFGLPVLIGAAGLLLQPARRQLRPAHLLTLLGALFVLSYLCRVAAHGNQMSLVVVSYATQFRIMGFAAGCAAFIWIRSAAANSTDWLAAHGRTLVAALGSISVALCLSVRAYDYRAFEFQWALIPLLAALSCLVLYAWNPRCRHPVLRQMEGAVAYVGRTSYSLYLYHPLVIFLAGYSLNSWRSTVPQFVLSLLCAILSYELVERRLKGRLLARFGVRLHRQSAG